MRKLLARHAGLLVIAVATLLVAAVVLLTLFQLTNSREARAWAKRSYDTIVAAKDLCIAVRAAESGRRGFLLSGRDADLAPYNGAIARMDPLLADLLRLTAGEAPQQERLHRLSDLVQAKRSELADSIQRRSRVGGSQAVVAAMQDGSGAALVTAIEATVVELQAEEERLLATRRQAADRAEALTRGLIIGGAILVVGLLALLAGLFMRRRSWTRELLETFDLGSCLVRDADGTIRFWSQGCTRLYGWTADEAVGRFARDVLGTVFPEAEQDIVAALRRYGAWSGDLRQRTRDGRAVVVNARMVLRREGRGRQGAVILESLIDVTAQRHAKAALAESESRFRTLAQAMPSLLFEANADGRMIYVNRRTEEYAGLSAAAIASGGWLQMVDPLDRAHVAEAWFASVRAGEPYELEYRLLGADGESRWFLGRGLPVRGPDGEILRWVGTCTDIDEHKRAAALQTRHVQRQLLLLEISRSVLEHGGGEATLAAMIFRHVAPVLGADFCLNYRFDNNTKELNLVAGPGLPPAELSGVRALRLDQGLCGSAAQTHEPMVADAEWIERDDRAALLRAMGVRAYVCHPLTGGDGQLLGTFSFASTSRDRFSAEEVDFLQTLCHFIALAWQRSQAEMALRESEARLRMALEAGQIGVFDWDLRTDEVRLDDRCRAMWGVPPGTTITRDMLFTYLPFEDRVRMDRILEQALDTANGGEYSAEYRVNGLSDDTEHHIAARGRVEFADGKPVRMIGTAVDISTQRRAEAVLARDKAELERLVAERTRELQTAQSRLAHAQRMEALGQLAGGIAHDFSNVLQAVQGGAALIERNAVNAQEVLRHARMLSEAAGRGAAITRRLLVFSRRGDLRAEAVDAAALLADTREILSHTLGTGIVVQVEAQPNLPRLLADKGQLETVLINLAANARDAMAGRGRLMLTAMPDVATRSEEGTPDARLSPGRYICLAVADTGIGMDADTLARASELFFTTKPADQGTGLGLAMARGFAEQSGGALHIESAPGRGTVVRLWFPVADRPATPGPAPSEKADAAIGKLRARLLVVDDDTIVRDVLVEQLEAEGYDVLAAGSGATALAMLDASERVDLMISDLSMPGLDGLTVIREAQRRRPSLPAVLLTGFVTDAAEIAVAGAISGTFSLLRKPVQMHVLAERIATLLEGVPAKE